MRDLLLDLRRALRFFRATPALALVMVGILGVGVAANTTVWSLVRGILMRPLPYAEPDRLRAIYTRYEPPSGYDIAQAALSGPEYLDYREGTRTLSGLAAWNVGDFNFVAPFGDPLRVEGIRATANLFEVLGTPPVVGRSFGPGEDEPGAPCLVVLSHRLWQGALGGERSVVGRDVRLDGSSCRVIGVMPPGFAFPTASAQLWTQMRLDPASPSWGRSSHWLLGVGRLAPGATQQAFEAELTYFGRTWAETYPDHHVGHGLIARDLRRDLVGDTRMPLLVLTGAVGLVFIAIAVNLVGLSVTRAEGRRREIAVRVALGAGRGRIARQLLLECLTIAVTGGLLGLIGAAWLIDAILAFYPGELPRAEAVRLDLAVAGVSLALSVLTGLVLAAASLWSATRFGPAEAIRASSRTASASGSSVRLRRALVVGQVAIGLSLVLAATLLVRAYVRITRTDLGFDPKDVVTFALTLPEPDYPTGDAVRRLVSDMTVRLGALPGVEAAGGVSALPLVSAGPPDDFMVEGRPAVRPGEPGLNARALTVTPGWFPALRVPLLRGRLLDDRDNAQAPLVAVINQAAARKYWPGEDPIGQRIRYYGPRDPWLTVVGIVGDLRSQSPTAAPEPAVYMPHAQPARETQTIRELSVTVRSRAGAPAAGPAIRAQVAALDPALPITELVPMTRVAVESVGDRRFTMLLMAAFAGVALLLSALGLYGVLTHLVQLRTREIGIRMALGASQIEVMRRVMGEGLALALAGVGLGLCLSLAGQRALSHLLFGISPGDPVTLAGVAVGLLVVAMVACLVPVRRASRVDPMTALRAE